MWARALVAVLVGCGCGVAATGVVVLVADRDAEPADRRAGTAAARAADAAGAPAGPRDVLRRWDAERAAAWASADTAALGSLYAPGSAAGRRDVAMLRAWNRRGARVTSMSTQVLALRVLVEEADRLVLRVTDRLVDVRAGVVALPRDEVSTRTVALRRVGGSWRAASVSEPRARSR